jgi:RNA polymerase sigma-70 factor, ECF subfamily
MPLVSKAETAVHAAAEQAARAAYGRLLSVLAWQWRDIAAAEDALADALLTALQAWPKTGVPTQPEAWLMTVAKRKLLHARRRRQLVEDPTLTILHPNDETPAPEAEAMPDQRLNLMLVCAHPAIDPSVRSALMLQTVLGLDAARIASAFLVSAETMTKRLVRAKAKIRQAGIRFEQPEPRELQARLSWVLEAIYGAYTLDWDREDIAFTDSLASEAWFLADLVVALLPGSAEALGLLSLIELCEARRGARFDDEGVVVPLDVQDTALWQRPLIDRAGHRLQEAAALQDIGPFQIEAAIQMAHCSRVRGGGTPWHDIRQLYEGLLKLHTTVGATLGFALATAYAAGNAQDGMRVLEQVEHPARESHQPWWAAKAHLLRMAGLRVEAIEAYGRAIELAGSNATKRTLTARRAALIGPLH